MTSRLTCACVARMSYRLHAARWPWLAACLLPLIWHGVESALRPAPRIQTPVAAAPCASEVVLGRTLGLMSTPVPKAPAESWKRPPCGDVEVQINGACWILPAYVDGGTPSAPCPNNLWEHKGRCWKPVGKDTRPPTSLGR